MSITNISLIIVIVVVTVLIGRYLDDRWFGFFQTTKRLNNTPLNLPLSQPKIVVVKSKRQLNLYSSEQLIRQYPIALGGDPVNDKIKEGDQRTPEGEFYIYVKNPKSKYFLSLGISYPNQEDASRGLQSGLITQDEYQQIIAAVTHQQMPPQKTALGGEIYIHGHGAHRDWTWGCVALNDSDMKELFDAIPKGVPVTITP